MTWLDLGNSWRNLYLLSCMLTAFALGVLFAVHHLFAKRSRVACFLTGVAATPFVQYLWTLLLALVWPRASKWVYIGGLPLLAGLYLAGAECADDAVAPEGWVKWTIPDFEYLRAECTSQTVFADMLQYLKEQEMELAGAVQDFTDPKNGHNYMLFPTKRL